MSFSFKRIPIYIQTAYRYFLAKYRYFRAKLSFVKYNIVSPIKYVFIFISAFFQKDNLTVCVGFLQAAQDKVIIGKKARYTGMLTNCTSEQKESIVRFSATPCSKKSNNGCFFETKIKLKPMDSTVFEIEFDWLKFIAAKFDNNSVNFEKSHFDSTFKSGWHRVKLEIFDGLKWNGVNITQKVVGKQ